MSKGYVGFTYKNWKGVTSFRRVIPHKLAKMKYPIDGTIQWCLTGFCIDKQDIRTFKLEDITNVDKFLTRLDGKVLKSQIDVYKLEQSWGMI